MSERAPNRKRSRPWRAPSQVIGDTRGGTSIEYGLILALVFLTMLASVQGVANITVSMWNNISTKVQNPH